MSLLDNKYLFIEKCLLINDNIGVKDRAGVILQPIEGLPGTSSQGKIPMSDYHEEGKKKFRLGLMIKRFFFLALPVLVLVGAVVGFAAMGALKPQPEEKAETIEALPVLTVIAASESVELSIKTQGEVVPRSEVTLAAQIGGRVSYVSPNLLAGHRFRRGDILVRIEDKEFRLRVVQAEANVAQAKTVYIREVSEGDTAAQDTADLGIESVSDLTLRRPQLAEAEARVASANAALDEAKLQLSRTIIRAPFAGLVREKSVDVGAFISPGTNLGQIYASDIADVPIPLTDTDLANLGLGIGFVETASNPGPDVALSAIVAGEHHTWTGRITRTASGFDPATRVLFAYVEVRDPYGSGADNGTPLASGLFVTADIAGRTLAESIVLPRTALRGKDTVFVVTADDTMEIRPVTVAFSERDRVVITAGLSVGEQVVISPVKGAADGMKINPVERLDTEQLEDSDDATAQLVSTQE